MTNSKTSNSSISAFIVCCNEERNIRRCLESVKWCDEIVVIDSGSTDQTLKICQEFNTRIVQRSWPGFVAQKRFGLSECKSNWVLNIDADEEVSEELAREIQLRIREKSNIAGFELLRIVYYWGRFWLRGGWYPEYRLRVCKRDLTEWGGEDPHDKASVQGTVERLKSPLYHYTYDDLASQIRSLNSHSSASAEQMYKQGRKASITGILLNPLVRFFKFYFVKRGFLEGRAGLCVAVVEAFYVFLKYTKLWEKQEKFPPAKSSPPS